ncbi:MAG: glycoside hydrolase family 28 protein [Lachnospiraceae bacterium]
MVFNILDYGADKSGRVNSAYAIQKAIDDCSENGGRVYVPAGRFLSGFLRLRSNVELYLEQGAELISDLREDTGYFLYANNEKNITISGEGRIDGQGRLRFEDDGADRGYGECPLNVTGNRPRTSFFENIENLTVRNITFYDAAFWTLHMAGCKNVLIDGIRILNNDRGPNSDGIDPDCCQNVVIQNCLIESGDDSIVVKATKSMHEKYGDCENIIIKGCVLHSRDSALKIGTETWGNIRQVIMSDCIIKDCSRAVGIWSRDGGTISDIYIHHIMGNTKRYADCPQRSFAPRWWGKGEPIFISATKRKDGDRIPGKIHHIQMDHIRITSESCIFIGGEEYAPIEHIRFQDIEIVWKKQGLHLPDVFDEQPSARDVYKHEIPCIYSRYGDYVQFSGKFIVEESLKDVVKEEKITEHSREFCLKLDE